MDCFLHYNLQSKDEARLMRECFQENKIDYREIDNLILISSNSLRFTDIAILIYKKFSETSFSKTDYLYLYTANSQPSWFCIIIKKIGHSRIFNIVLQLRKMTNGICK